MGGSWRIGTAFGIGVFVHWTFFLLPALLAWHDLSAGQVQEAFYAVSMVIAVFGCVVLHEFGHALMARRYGIGTQSITLYPIGGVVRLERMSENPREEFWIALAGPAVNVVIAAGLWGVLSLLNLGGDFGDPYAFLEGGDFLLGLMVTNIWLVLFNLLPAFPMDGGRVLRALLAYRVGRLRATEIAVGLGTFMALVFGIVGLIGPGPFMLGLVAVFVYFAGQQELAMVRYREARRATEPLDVLPVDGEVYESPAAGAFSGFTWDGRSRQWVQWRDGRPIHTISVD